MPKILITGASGFVGRRLASYLSAKGLDVRCAYRELPDNHLGDAVSIGSIGAETDWTNALKGCDVVVHLAGHVGGHGVSDEYFSEVNDRGTSRLVEQARTSHARLLINASTIAVVTGHASRSVVNDQTPTGDYSAYGRSKLAGEGHMAKFVEIDRHAISLRAPMLYGDHASGNWRLLNRVAASGIPLPLSMFRNRRNLLAVDNFVHAVALLVTMDHDKLHSGSYAIADQEAVSTADIVRLMRYRMQRPALLFPFPPSLLRVALGLIGQRSAADSLTGDLEIDSGNFRKTFNWEQPLTSHQAIAGGSLLSQSHNIP